MRIAVVAAKTTSHASLRMDMLHGFIERGHEVIAFGDEPEEDWSDFFAKERMEYRSFRVCRTGINPFNDLKTFFDLRRLFRQEGPDKVFSYHPKANIYSTLAAQAEGVPDIYAMVAGLGSNFVHNNLRSVFVRSVMLLEYRVAFRSANAVFVQNGDDIDYLAKKGVLPRSKAVKVNGSGVNLDNFAFSEPRVPACFVFVGRLLRDKGVGEYLEAARVLKREMPESTFHVVGPIDSNPSSISKGDITPFIEEGSVIYHGSQDDVRPFLRNASVFVLPSYREGTPKSALEAMATGRAVVTCDVPGCREVVEDGVNGILVKPGDAESLVRAMRRLASDFDLACRMGVESRRIAEERFDVRKVNKVICEAMSL